MKNIILIGMPGSGKSTLGVLLAKTLGAEFIDTDILIQKKYGGLLQELIEKNGISAFLDMERDVLLSLRAQNAVIATGGSAVLRKESMLHLKKDGIVLWLSLPCSVVKRRIRNIKTRGIAAEKGENIRDIFNARRPFYEQYADFTVDCAGNTAESNVARIVSLLSGREGRGAPFLKTREKTRGK